MSGKFALMFLAAFLPFAASAISFAKVQGPELCSASEVQSGLESPVVVDGKTRQVIDIKNELGLVQPGDVVVIGENHGLKEHQTAQIQVMRVLRQLGRKVSVGMEFLNYTDQSLVDSYRKADLGEADFLKQINWGSPSFDFYRDQVQFPKLDEGAKTWALNMPRRVTTFVAKNGLEKLPDEMQKLMPPNFQLGSDKYRERFYLLMPHLPDKEAAARYFAAQSIWDDTMAWNAMAAVGANPEAVLVIVVGEFHTQYGGGLPDRLTSRGAKKVWTLGLINTFGMSSEEIQQAIQPDASGTPRENWLWLQPVPPNMEASVFGG